MAGVRGSAQAIDVACCHNRSSAGTLPLLQIPEEKKRRLTARDVANEGELVRRKS